MKSERWASPKNLWLIKVRGGHPFGLMQIPNSNGSNGKKTWYTLSIIYFINPTISLVQVVYFYVSGERGPLKFKYEIQKG